MLSSPAVAQDLKPLCPDRGAIQPCVVDPGHVQVEVSLTDWFDDADSTLLLGDTVVRLGLNENTEVQVGLSPWVRKGSRVGQGDLRLALRRNIKDDQLSLAVQPMLVLPTGSQNASQGRLGAGVALGATYDVSPSTQLYASPTVFVLPTPLISGAVGVNQTLYGPIGGTIEVFAQHSAGQTQASLDFTTVWTASRNVEIDLNANVGLTRDTPTLELVLGVTKRF
jgi:hypothetical protein